MTPLGRLPRHALVSAVLLLLLTSGCGGDRTRTEQRAASAATFDKALHDRLPAGILGRGTLRVGGSDPYPPASLFAADGRTVVGFEPDLAAAMGRVLGVRFEFVNVAFADLLTQLKRHRIDVAIASMTDTAEREQHADFVNYFQAGTAIIVQRGNPQGISALKDLCGKVVAVEAETTQVDLLRRVQKGCEAGKTIDVRTFGDNANALVQLRTGRTIAVLSDYPIAVHVASDERTRAHYQLAASTQYEPSPYGIAVAKDQTGLRDVLRDALSASSARASMPRCCGVGASPAVRCNPRPSTRAAPGRAPVDPAYLVIRKRRWVAAGVWIARRSRAGQAGRRGARTSSSRRRSTGTRWIDSSSTSPARMNCWPVSAPPITAPR